MAGKPKSQPVEKAAPAREKPAADENGHVASATEQILTWFEDYVERYGVKVGDALPSEDEIMRATATSRSSVREAINQMKALGVVDSRRKRGMRLERPPQLLELIRMLGSRTIPRELLGHVGSFRCALEFGLATEIFRKATDQDVAELRTIVDKMAAHRNEPKVWNEWDCHFHEKMLSIPQNKIAIWLSHILNPYFVTISDSIPPMIDSTRMLHNRIVEALEQRDFAKFYKAVYDHDYHKLSTNMELWPRVVIDYQHDGLAGALLNPDLMQMPGSPNPTEPPAAAARPAAKRPVRRAPAVARSTK